MRRSTWTRSRRARRSPPALAPVRAELGLRAFGASAYRGEPGETVVPLHRELGEGAGNHEELDVASTGRATFEVEGRSLDAPAQRGDLAPP